MKGWGAAILTLLGAAASAIAEAVRPKAPEPPAPPPTPTGFDAADKRVDEALARERTTPNGSPQAGG